MNYIVRNTVGSIVKARWEEALINNSSLIDATLSVKVLDPAMGSGHFLVGSVDFLAGKLMQAAERDIEWERVEDKDQFTNEWAKREVVSHCIYGVDLNDLAVELAKVSLWLTTIAKDKPLSFLDHRLKQGNSLIGAKLSDLKYYPKDKKQAKDQVTLPSFVSPLFIQHLIKKIKELEEIGDDSLSEIKRKEGVFEEFKALPEYTKAKAIANVHTAVYFGNEVEPKKTPSGMKSSDMVYHDLFWAVGGDESEWRRKTRWPWFDRAQDMALERSFFNWELEFPEIFFEGGSIKESPGFDVVIGNPPYFSMERVTYLQPVFEILHHEIYAGKLDISNYFIKIGLDLVKNEGRVAYITARYFLEAIHGAKLRDSCTKRSLIKLIVDFGNFQVFDANVLTIIILMERRSIIPVDSRVEILKYDEISSEISLDLPNSGFNRFTIPYENFNSGPWFLNDPKTNYIYNKINLVSCPLIDICRIGKGMESGLNEAFVVTKSVIDDGKLEKSRIRNHVQGKDLTRYHINHRDLFLIYNEGIEDISDYPFIHNYLMGFKEKLEKRKNFILGNCKWYTYGSPLNTDIYENAAEKLIVPYMATHARFGYDSCGDREKFFTLTDTTIIVMKEDNNYELKYILSLLNSSLLNHIHQRSSKLKRDGYYEYFSKTMEHLPIRRISFTTHPIERTRLVSELKNLYAVKNFQKILFGIDSYIPKCSEDLAIKQEKSDVVHDYLAYLAEQLIRMNKEKEAEIKDFLRWLECYIGAKVEDLTNKTKIQEYYENDFSKLLDILEENKRKLSINPKKRNSIDDLAREYEDSKSKLQPILQQIKETDGLIDKIVYKLYGLTDEETAIVDQAIR